MATFVLVHGGCHGGWCWSRVAPLLRAAGHEVNTPTLTGLGERAHLVSPTVNLSTHIKDVVNVLFYEDLRDVVLVGHSYAGMVITGVAEREPTRLGRLVYLDATVAEDRQSLFDAVADRNPHMLDRWTAGAMEVNGALVFPASSDFFDESLAAWYVTDPADIEWVRPRLTPHPVASVAEALHISEHRAAQIPRSFIRCAGPRGNPAPMSTNAVRALAGGFDYYEIESGHDAMVTAPRELTDVLVEIARLSS